jgi:sulfur relay protein TusB/DsrH
MAEMTVYLIDEIFADAAFAYASKDPSAKVVLLQDGVYIAKRGTFKGEVYYIKDDATLRGLGDSFPSGAHPIDFDGLVAMMEADKVVNFL